MKKDLELYVHIPFCVRKCAYCDFLSFSCSAQKREAYTETLKREIREAFPAGGAAADFDSYRVTTVFFGGGTPSVLPGAQIAAILQELRTRFCFAPDAEISIECNPGTADQDKLKLYRASGINRLSIGLQSADDGELAQLGRIHTWADFCRTYEAARDVGFDNINIDLMSALPGQTQDSWEQTLHRVLACRPEHISAYSLIIEEGTPFYEKYGKDDERRARGETPRYLPDEETERQMYERTQQLLAGAGLHRYEISNYAKDGYECRHNKGYWQGVPYLGFGLGASSFFGQVRWHKTQDLNAYLAGDFSAQETQLLTEKEQIEEFMYLGLRLAEGVSKDDFFRRFGKRVDETYETVLERQLRLGLLEKRDGRIRLTPRGMDLSNMVMAEFLLP